MRLGARQCGEVGARSIRRSPCRLIADNAGVEGEVIVQALKGTPFQTGYNAMDDRIENLIDAGVIDPAKVCPFTEQQQHQTP